MTHPWYTRPAGFEIPTQWNLSSDTREYILDQLWEMFLTGDSDVESFLELVEDDISAAAVSPADVELFFAQMLALRRTQQEGLGGTPQSDLTSAFSELELVGVIARENFSCCGTCASSEIGDERDDSRPWRGYIYYHTQDAERIPEERQTYIGYGAFLDQFITEDEWNQLSDSDKDSTYERIVTDLMNNEIFPILNKHGITPVWNQDLGTRVLLQNVDLFIPA